MAFRLREHDLDWMPLAVPAPVFLRRAGPYVKTSASNDADYLAPFITETENLTIKINRPSSMRGCHGFNHARERRPDLICAP